ncbi:hypothetical protein IQ07DRAFT_602758 [Pyrenochaeta sp. DS3sAY3a]|nr:hypothetical protein IQ07DRAFT_602758 [Pyrenochaeta sp. DS3sAY3a]
MSSTDNSILDQLIGAWELLDHCAFLPHDEQNRAYPLGEPKGMIFFTGDGYMSTQMLSSSSKNSSTDSDPAFMGNKYMAYSGRYHLRKDDHGIWLKTTVLMSNMPDMVGTTQTRLVKFTPKDDNGRTCLALQPEQPMKVAGEDRIIRVRWARPPGGDLDQILKQSGI